ncbi:adenine phosphoribosyltransferase [Kineosporiaceae bacterium SCSIO 59966]|nr:adenine phosphoribosyltransferase [Kineosporiaceae bacterium SCSIO 59966]
MSTAREQALLARIRDVPDYPKPGVLFKDITPLLADPGTFRASIEALADLVPAGTQAVAGIEARGFVLAAPLALHLGVGFVPVRKAGKLPSDVVAEVYDLEYGSAEIEVHADAFPNGQRVVLVDDVLATGGTAVAAWGLLERAGAHVVGARCLMEIEALRGREKLAGRDVVSVLTV